MFDLSQRLYTNSCLRILTHALRYKIINPFAHALKHSPVLSDAIFDLDASTQKDGKVVDSIAKMQFTDMNTKVDADNVKYFDLSQSSTAYMERKAVVLREGLYYTHAYVLKWRASDGGSRTLLFHDPDRCAKVKAGSKSLMVYSHRNGEWRDSGYDIVPQQAYWELVVVTGAGTSSTSLSGTTTFYTMDASTRKMVLRGTADRVCSGLNYYRIGDVGQPPGKIARIVTWKRVLSMNEIQALALQLGMW